MIKKQRNKILLLWLMTYCMIGIISVVSVIFSYSISSEMVKGNALRRNDISLASIKSNFDRYFSSLEKIVVLSGNNETLKNFSHNYGELNRYEIYNMRKFAHELEAYKETLDNVHSAFYYCKNRQWVLSLNSESVSSDVYYDMLQLDCNYVQWQELMSTDTKNFLVPVDGKDGEKYFLYVSKNYFVRSFKNDNISFCALLKQSDFTFVPDGMGLNIRKKDTHDIIRINTDLSVSDKNLEYTSGDIRCDGKNYVYGVIPSDTWELEYIVLTSEEEVFAEFNRLKKTHFAIFFILIILTGFLSCWFAQKTSNGLTMVLETLGEQISDFHGFDLFKKIGLEIEKLKHNYLLSLESNKAHLQKLKESYLLEMCVATKENTELLEKELKDSGVNFLYPNYSVMIIYPQTNEDFTIDLYAINSIVRNMLTKQCEFLIVERGCLIICILNYKSEDYKNELPFELQEIVKCIIEFIGERLGENIYHTISRSVVGLGQLSTAYREALSAMDELITEEVEVNINNDRNLVTDNGHWSIEREKKLISAIQKGDTTVAEQLVHEIFFELKSSREATEFGMKYFVYDLYCTIIRLAVELGEDAAAYMREKRFLSRLEKLELERDFRRLTIECVRGLSGFSKCIEDEDKIEKKSVMFEKRITEYIYDHYADYDLGLQKIADYMKMNPAYISISFKEQCGEGISDRIENYRMLKAIELLEQGEKINEIANKVGYHNARTFSKAFKRKYNIAPSKFNNE